MRRGSVILRTHEGLGLRGGGVGVLGRLTLALETAIFWGELRPPVHEMVMASPASLHVAEGNVWAHVLTVTRL